MGDAKTIVKPCFVNLWVDAFFVGGFSILCYMLCLAGESTGVIDTAFKATLTQVTLVLLWLGNHPHFSATSYRLYHSRANIAQYPITAVATPLVVGVLVILSCWYPTLLAPMFLKVYLIWSPYHFSGQTVGITMIYARRTGLMVTKPMRWLLSSFIFGTFLTQTMMSEAGMTSVMHYDVAVPAMGIPLLMATAAKYLMYASGIGFFLYALRWMAAEQRLIHPLVLLPAISQYVWFIVGSHVESFRDFVPFFHSLQYLFIAWIMQLKERMDHEHLSPSKAYVMSETMRWFVLNVLGGLALFLLLPYIFIWLGVQWGLAMAVVLAGVQLHHFIVDGVIWKLKRASVSSPLLVNLDDLARPEPA